MLDAQATEVRAYDPSGRYLQTVVRGGEGPGEITAANGIILAGDTLLWLNDHGKWMIVGVDRAGGEVHRFDMPIRSYGYIWSGVFDDRGRYWRHRSEREGGFTYPPPPALSSSTYHNYFVSYDLASEAVDSVYLGETGGRSYTYQDPSGIWQYLPIEFEPSDLFVFDPSGGFWRAKPILAGMFVDDADTLWVERVVSSDAPAFYDRFSAEGDYLGSVRLAFKPARDRVWVQHGSIYAWVVDELDVPYVVRAPVG